MAIQVDIGHHDPGVLPVVGMRVRLKSGGGVQHRLDLKEACSSPEPIASNQAIAGRKAFARSAHGQLLKLLSARSRLLRLLASARGQLLNLMSAHGQLLRLLSARSRLLKLVASARGQLLQPQLYLMVTEDPMRPKQRACVARLAAKAMWEDILHQFQ